MGPTAAIAQQPADTARPAAVPESLRREITAIEHRVAGHSSHVP